MHEESADFGGIVRWVKQGVFASGVLVAAVESFPFAPAAAGDDQGLSDLRVGRFRGEICSVRDELGGDAVDRLQCPFDLRGGIVVGLESADGGFDDFTQSRDVADSRFPQGKCHCRLSILTSAF